jgi:thymidylate synthase (FAD)
MELPAGWAYIPESSTASDLAEFAGRACYRSWSRPNPATATNEGYLRNIIDQQHFSVLEHGSVSLYVEGVSRSLTHELVRHRHFSFSQLSQRYVDVGKQSDVNSEADYVIPPLFDDDVDAQQVLHHAWHYAVESYRLLEALAFKTLAQKGVVGTAKTKQAREAARAVLPNMAPTAIVVTGNHRSWREFLQKRATVHADAEMARFAMFVYYALTDLEPSMYLDAEVQTEGDREVLVWP